MKGFFVGILSSHKRYYPVFPNEIISKSLEGTSNGPRLQPESEQSLRSSSANHPRIKPGSREKKSPQRESKTPPDSPPLPGQGSLPCYMRRAVGVRFIAPPDERSNVGTWLKVEPTEAITARCWRMKVVSREPYFTLFVLEQQGTKSVFVYRKIFERR